MKNRVDILVVIKLTLQVNRHNKPALAILYIISLFTYCMYKKKNILLYLRKTISIIAV